MAGVYRPILTRPRTGIVAPFALECHVYLGAATIRRHPFEAIGALFLVDCSGQLDLFGDRSILIDADQQVFREVLAEPKSSPLR